MADKPRQQASITATGRISKDTKAVGKLTVTSLAVNQRIKKDGEWTDGPTMWFDLSTAGPQLVEASKGDLVTVEGRLAMREYNGKLYYTIWVEKLANASVDSDFPVGA
jgi:single-stranded DNA-binding protein